MTKEIKGFKVEILSKNWENYAQEKQKSSIRQYNKTAKEKKEVESDILDDWKIYPRKLEAKEIMFFAHTS